MGLSLRQKSDLYRELGKLLGAGRPFPTAIELLHGETHGVVKKLLGQIQQAISRGATVGDAFAAQYPLVPPLESSIISASERTGRLNQGCAQLSEYYDRLDVARRAVLKQLRYPVFVLHLAAFTNGLPALVLGGSASVYLKGSVGVLVLIYLCCIALWIVASLITFEGTRRVAVDGFLRMIPILGKLRRSFALARFCATYEMQLQAGVNVMDGLAAAGNASQSALVNDVVKRAIPLVRGGAQVGPLLSGSSAFTQQMVRSIKIGEETGELDAELKRLSDEFQIEAAAQLDLLGAVFAKGVYFLVVFYVVYVLIKGTLGYVHSIDSLMQ